MRYFIDTEFHEQGHLHPVQLISIGIISDDDRTFYAENSDYDLSTASPWLKENVIPHLERSTFNDSDFESGRIKPHKEIGPAILKYLGMDAKPYFWGYFADYDWVVFCQLFGSMVDLPPSFPMFCRDLKQEMKMRGISKPSLGSFGSAHNALSDAKWNKALFNYMASKGHKLEW